jgi:hypothetical protein
MRSVDDLRAAGDSSPKEKLIFAARDSKARIEREIELPNYRRRDQGVSGQTIPKDSAICELR